MHRILLILVGVIVAAACGSSTPPEDDSGSGASGAGAVEDPAWFTCAQNSECELAPTTCCETCGPQSTASVRGVNNALLTAWGEFACAAEGNPICPPADCATATEHVIAQCRGTVCEAVDVREDTLTACGMDSDCLLRWGADCCELCNTDGASTGLVAVNNAGVQEYTMLVCGGASTCPACMPPPVPPGSMAVCNANNHCEVAF